jgi:hypothetical protein
MHLKNVFIPMALALAVSPSLYAAPVEKQTSVIKKTLKDTLNETSSAKNKRYEHPGYKIKPDHNGERQLNMNNPVHYQLAKSRLEMTNMRVEDYPQLHQSLDDGAQQQRQKEAQSLTSSKQAVTNLTAEETTLIENSHMFLNMQIAVSPLDNEAYLVVRAESSIYGGSIATYIDIIMWDENQSILAPGGSGFNILEGTEEIAVTQISLRTLKQNYPNLDTIYTDSMVIADTLDGIMTSGLRYTEYPWDWQSIEAIYGPYMGVPAVAGKVANAITGSIMGKPQYSATAPVDVNTDGVIKVCLNRNHSDCDYAADQYQDPNFITDVNIPFVGEVTIPHEVFVIYSSHSTDPQPIGLDERTNIYLQEGVYGGTTKQSYGSLMGVGGKRFSDYLSFAVDPVAKQTVISWNIPREEGRFGNAQLYSNIAQANWRLNFAVQAKSFFRGRTGNFQFQINTNTIEALQNFFSPGLPLMKLGYSCLAKGTLITMADGSQKPIDQILAGEMVLGAVAKNSSAVQPMRVMDVSIGVEALQMFRVTSADGREILMTETHPVSTSNKGIVWAKELAAGDRILTEHGSVLISKISEEQYNDNVYNLKLAPRADSKIAQGTYLGMFANGLLVGDLATQDEHNYKDQFIRQTSAEKLQRLPAKWKVDYISSLEGK